MIARRDRFRRRLGATLSGFALGLQLMLSSIGMVLAAAVDPGAPFGDHALCLAGGAGERQAGPSGGAPLAPAHPHIGLCCLWHQLPGVAAAPAQVQPVRYVRTAAIAALPAAFAPGPQTGPANAREPPTLA